MNTVVNCNSANSNAIKCAMKQRINGQAIKQADQLSDGYFGDTSCC